MRDRSTTVQMLAVLIAGLLFAAAGGVWLQESDSADAAVRDNPVASLATSTTSSSVAPAAAPVSVPRPVDVPADSYAAEPVQEIGTIEIPKIGLTHKVMHGITMRNIDKGPSHWPGTAMPGENGNTVFAGHRVTKTHPFRRIHELEPGDQVIFNVAGVRSVYVVTGHEVVTPKGLHIVNQTAAPTGTLFACHPPGSARYRYVVKLALLADG